MSLTGISYYASHVPSLNINSLTLLHILTVWVSRSLSTFFQILLLWWDRFKIYHFNHFCFQFSGFKSIHNVVHPSKFEYNAAFYIVLCVFKVCWASGICELRVLTKFGKVSTFLQMCGSGCAAHPSPHLSLRAPSMCMLVILCGLKVHVILIIF